ncbi:extracellular solute-binding protein [Paenibacillus sp. GCM10012303]|uniref:extracellular solute-binding protein n=1 Tax=Paenibacillus sp. GCM10012303 TaxID=3317340 RepID=UPI00361CE56F
MIGYRQSAFNRIALGALLALLPAVSGCSYMKAQTSEPFTLELIRSDHPAQVLRTDTPVLKEIRRITGITLNLVPVPLSSYSDKKRSLMTTGHMPDILLINPNEMTEFARTGIFLPVSDYLEQMPHFRSILKENPLMQRLYVDGKLYGFPVTAEHYIQNAKAPMIRTDILMKHQLEVPRTFDELYTVLQKLKELYPDSIPWTARGIGSFLNAVAFGLGSGAGMYFDPDLGGGRYLYGTNKREFKEVLMYLNRLYREELIDSDFDVNSQQRWSDNLGTGKSFFYYDNYTFALNFNEALKRDHPDYRLELIPYLANAKGSTRGFLYPKGWLSDIYAISSNVEDPLRVIKLFDWLYSPEGAMVSNFGIRGETYEILDGEPRVSARLAETYKQTADPIRMMQSEVGAGLLAISPLVDERPAMELSSPDLLRWSEQLKRDPGAIVIDNLAPSFTKEERDRLTHIRSRLAPLEQELLKFIIGTRPLSEYEAYAEQLTGAGVPEMETIYNDALARVRP